MSSSLTASSRQHPSVSAVVLSVGETTTDRAIESVKNQSIPVSEIIVIRDEMPFHRALNKGAAQVRSRFFVQVDADMILDRECIDALLACASDDVGIVAGYLRDPLIGWRCCIKLFRTACFAQVAFRNTVSPDTDFVQEIEAQGFAIVYAVRLNHDQPEFRRTFGQHNPDYTISYTFRKHLIEGRRYTYRNNFPSFRWLIEQLERRQDEISFTAQVATAHGLFLGGRHDQLTPEWNDDDQAIWLSFMQRLGTNEANKTKLLLAFLIFAFSPAGSYKRHYRLGMALGQYGTSCESQDWLHRMGGADSNARAIAKIGYCHGLCQSRFESQEACENFDFVRKFVGEDWPKLSWPERIEMRFFEATAVFKLLRIGSRRSEDAKDSSGCSC